MRFDPPHYVFQGVVRYDRIEELLEWLEANLVSKQPGIQRRFYSVHFPIRQIGAISNVEDYKSSIPLEVTIYEGSYAAIFKLRWVDEAA